MKKTLLALVILTTMVPAMASALHVELTNVMVTSYSVNSSAPYDVEIRRERGRLRGWVSYDHKVVARNLEVKVSNCREGRTRPTGKFKSTRRGRRLELHLEVNYGQSDKRRPQFCEIVLDDLPLAADHAGPQASPPASGRPGQPPD